MHCWMSEGTREFVIAPRVVNQHWYVSLYQPLYGHKKDWRWYKRQFHVSFFALCIVCRHVLQFTKIRNSNTENLWKGPTVKRENHPESEHETRYFSKLLLANCGSCLLLQWCNYYLQCRTVVTARRWEWKRGQVLTVREPLLPELSFFVRSCSPQHIFPVIPLFHFCSLSVTHT